MKRYVRRRTDQQYNTMLLSTEQSRGHFVEIQLYKKLSHRFWNACLSYKQGQSYQHILKLFFSDSCKGKFCSQKNCK